jgi:hypothetical protein
VDVLDSAWSETRVQLLSVEASHVRSGEGLKLQPTECGFDVYPGYLLVPFVSALPHGILYSVGEPAIQVLSDGESARIEGKASVSVGYRPSQLFSGFLP